MQSQCICSATAVQVVYAHCAFRWRVRVQVITRWTGGQADALRQALRMTNESYAEHLGVAVRTIAYWRKRPEIIPLSAIQETLDAPSSPSW